MKMSTLGRVSWTTAAGLAVIAGAAPAMAQSLSDASMQTPPVIQANREFEIGALALSRSYKESFPVGVSGRDRESGWTPGVAAQARWIGDVGSASHLFVALQVVYNAGNVDYRGSVFATDTSLNFRSGLSNTLVRAEAGKGFLITPRLLITPVAQVGYQVWNRNLGAGQTEDYRTLTAGLGLHADYELARRLILRGNLGLAGMIKPQITFNYINSYPADLAARAVYQGGVGVDYALTGHFHLSADARISQYGYGRSASLTTVERGRIFEPASATTDTLMQLGLAYAF